MNGINSMIWLAYTGIFALIAAFFTLQTLCIEYCLETWSGDPWHGGLCFLMCFLPPMHLAIFAAIITACVV